ncbi:hypothetical protein T4B_9702 [Trichinella pseudospiralis]|uniref:Uncharacterized protein n=1 Tax=Trichinella pseudospiralis TaxID=6337 RepID=A0A0V1GBU6_TRIPS|nr:hypothetical protein T4B_9702 [Trichinella pseudospiralis]
MVAKVGIAYVNTLGIGHSSWNGVPITIYITH